MGHPMQTNPPMSAGGASMCASAPTWEPAGWSPRIGRNSIGLKLAFVIYTLGFYVYSIRVFYGMDPFLKGYLVHAAAICLPLLTWPYPKVLAASAPGKAVDFMLWLLLSYLLVWMVAIGAQQTNPVEFSNYLGAIIVWSMLFMMGRRIPYYGWLRFLALAVLLALLALILIYSEGGTFTPAQSPDTFATYQAYAVVLCIVTPPGCLVSSRLTRRSHPDCRAIGGGV